MKAIHLADLHLGKSVNGFPMIADQRAVLAQVVQYADTHRPDCVFIAGDVYDKPVPSAEAVALLDDFLVQLAHRVPHTFVISGNHDSAERIAFGGRLMARCGVHLAPVYGGRVAPIPVPDAHGAVNVYMLPFVKPVQVRQLCDPAVETYSDAVRAAVAQMQPDPAARNVLITHQFVAGAQCSDSEEVSVGGTDAVDAALLAGFDYVALGHLHRPQAVGRDTVRYAGSPLCYSFSEAPYPKSIPLVELGAKGDCRVTLLPLTPPHPMTELRGTYMKLMDTHFYEHTTYRTDYTHITLTDEEDIPEAIGRLRTVYANLMKLDYDNRRTRALGVDADAPQPGRSPAELFAELYTAQNNQPLTDAQRAYLDAQIAQIWG